MIAAAPRYLAECYGGDIEALADVVGDFDAQSPEESTTFLLRQWTNIAEPLGFARELSEAAAAIRGTRLGLVGMHAAALAAFERWSTAPRRPFSPAIPAAIRSARAKVRHDVLVAFGEQRRGKLWAIDEPAANLPAKACFERGPATNVSGRAFLVDAAENFFHGNRQGNKAPSTCGWDTPVILSLGTFPWVFGSKLHRSAPGLDWDAAPPSNPAAIAMRLAASLWQPLGNLQQDATQVVQRYRHYTRAAELALAQLPTWPKSQPGALVRKGLLLHIDHGSLDTAGANSSLGYLSATAHNYIVHRFAAFFAVRRAHARVAAKLPIELRRTIAHNPDPCLSRLTDDPLARGLTATRA
jgi:hypothetical protein